MALASGCPTSSGHSGDWNQSRHDPNNLRRTFARITEGAGLGRWHPNELRHSAAPILSSAGVPLERIADVLGHDGTRMTAQIYRHAVAPTIDDASVMDQILT